MAEQKTQEQKKPVPKAETPKPPAPWQQDQDEAWNGW